MIHITDYKDKAIVYDALNHRYVLRHQSINFSYGCIQLTPEITPDVIIALGLALAKDAQVTDGNVSDENTVSVPKEKRAYNRKK